MLTPQQLIQNIVGFVVLIFQVTVLWSWALIRPLFPAQKKDISNEIVFITGGGSGIGRMMAYEFAKLGAFVICTDMNKKACDETEENIILMKGKAQSFELDVTQRDAVYRLASHISASIGNVTILVNNAGIVTGKSILDCPDNMMAKVVDVNTISHFWTLKAFLPSMMENNHGHVVSIASIAGFSGAPAMVEYCASKFGAVGLMESLTLELMKSAPLVRTTVVCPWFIKTGMFEGTVSSSPLLLPMLEPEYVGKQIIDAVRKDAAFLFLPRILWILVIMKNFMPMSVSRCLAEYLQLHNQMTGFVGRNKSD